MRGYHGKIPLSLRNGTHVAAADIQPPRQSRWERYLRRTITEVALENRKVHSR